jgi:hypothetical protein
MKKIASLSDVSRTNQLRISEPPEIVASKLFQHLFKSGRGIESFIANSLDLSPFDQSLKLYQKQHKAIKGEIQKRLARHNEMLNESDIQYSLSYVDGKNFVFFLSPNKNHSV